MNGQIYKPIKYYYFGRRQTGLESERNKFVFDQRYSSVLDPSFFEYVKNISERADLQSLPKINDDQLSFITNYHPDDVIRKDSGIFPSSERCIIISGLVPEGVYGYSCCGSHESDPEYVAIRTFKEGIFSAKNELIGLKAKHIVCGLEINSKRLFQLIGEFEKIRKNLRIEEILKLPIEEQRKRLERLL